MEGEKQMIDYIAELQLKALEIVQREGLEKEYNKYMICKGSYSHTMRYMLIDFVLQYTELHLGELKREVKDND